MVWVETEFDKIWRNHDSLISLGAVHFRVRKTKGKRDLIVLTEMKRGES